MLLGYRPDEVVGRSIKFLFGPETDINKIRAAVKSASFREPYRMDVDIYGRSGNSQQVIVSCLQCQDSSDRCRISVETYNQEASPEKQTKRLEETKPFTHQVLDRVCIAQHIQPFGHTKKFRCFRPQSTITYIPFCDDFGPMNMACVSQFVILLDAELVHDTFSKIVYCVENGRRALTNAVFLLGAYMILKLKAPVEEVEDRFSWLDESAVEAFRDATFTEPDFALTLQDCWRGLARGVAAGWVDLPQAAGGELWGSIDMQAYAHFDEPLNGDLHMVVPGKLLAFRGPRDVGGAVFSDDAGYRDFSPRFYAPVLKKLGVTAVVRLNEAEYDAGALVSSGMEHRELPFEDCSAPSDEVVRAFLDTVDAAPGAVAVHCKAGLGRTGTLIALYMMRSHGFAAREAMGWLRIMRPGSVIGEQQHYLCAVEAEGRSFSATPAGPVRAAGAGTAAERRRRALQASQVEAAIGLRCAARARMGRVATCGV